MIAIETPFPTFCDLDGSPLDAGYVYFGQRNENPETDPVTVYWDAAGTQPAVQPIRTSNGYLVRSGTPAQVYVASDYSLTVRNRRREFVFSTRASARYAGQVADAFTATDGQTDFTLSRDPGTSAQVVVTLDGLTLSDTDYTLTGTTLTLATETAEGQELVVRYTITLPIGSVDAAQVVFTPEGASAVATNVQEKLRRLRDVVDLGADKTGVADSTSAFNALTAALRAAVVDTPDYDYAGFELKIPPGVYSVSSWDLTDLLIQNVHVIAHGAVIVARTGGKHVVDCIGSRYIKFHGLTIYSASGTLAKSGIQIGNKGTEACGNQAFNDVTIVGYYTHAPLMNLGSETTTARNLRLIQRHTDAGAYALIADGLTAAANVPTSDYATITKAAGTAVSFTNDSFHGCQIRNEGGGSAAYLAKTQGWSFDMGTYWLSFNDAAVVVYGTGTYRSEKLTLRGSFETNITDYPTAGNTGLKYAVKFTGDGTGTAVDGFAFESSNMHATVAVFHNAAAGAYRISDADIRVHSIEQAGARMFDAASVGAISVDGLLMTQAANKTNLGVLTAFNGSIHCDTYGSLVSQPAAGAYLLYSRSTSRAYLGGTFDSANAATLFTPTITFETVGDLSVSYAVQQGYYYQVGKIVVIKIYLTFTPTFTTSAGEFRIVGMPIASQNVATGDVGFEIAGFNAAWTWPAGTTQVTGRLPANATNIRLYAHGSGVASTAFDVTNVPSGSAKTVILSGSFLAE